MRSRPPAREFCAAGARRVGEPLFATASRVDVWLVLEVRTPWPDEVGESLDPSAPIGRALKPILQAVPRSRVLFIKGLPETPRQTLAFYVAVTDEIAPRLYHFELENYADLEALDLFGVLAEEERFDPFRLSQPLYLVCTHGTHDRCCAKYGFPTYLALSQSAPGRVWQSSHVGGDRFAANLVCLPHGLYYGHVEPGEAGTVRESTDAGRLYLPRLRGRACYPSPVQAAEHFLREARQETEIASYRLWSHRRRGEITEAVFLAGNGNRLYRVRVEPAPLPGLRFMTCGTEVEKPVTGYRNVSLEEEDFAPEACRAGALEYRLVPAAMRDYGFICRLRRETLQGYLEQHGMPAAEHGPFFARFDVDRHRLVTVGEVTAGAVSVLEREGGLHLANLHLVPHFQRRGLGSAIVREAQARAAAERRRMTTQVLKLNPARAFYERLGFRVEGEQGLRYRMVWEG